MELLGVRGVGLMRPFNPFRKEPHQEGIEGARREAQEIIERWDNRLSLDDPRLLERYREGDLLLHIHGVFGPDSEKFCAILKRDNGFTFPGSDAREPKAHGADRKPTVEVSVIPGSVNVQGVQHGGAADDMQRSMLMDSVEVVQPIQSGGFRPLRSIVRLQGLNYCLGLGRDPLDLPLGPLPSLYVSVFPKRSGFKFLRGFADRESGAIVPAPSVRNDKLPNDMVEDSPEIMNDFSGQDAESERKFFFNGAASDKTDGAFRRIRVWLTNDLIGLELEEGGQLVVQINDLLYGPLGLGIGAVKRVLQ